MVFPSSPPLNGSATSTGLETAKVCLWFRCPPMVLNDFLVLGQHFLLSCFVLFCFFFFFLVSPDDVNGRHRLAVRPALWVPTEANLYVRRMRHLLEYSGLVTWLFSCLWLELAILIAFRCVARVCHILVAFSFYRNLKHTSVVVSRENRRNSSVLCQSCRILRSRALYGASYVFMEGVGRFFAPLSSSTGVNETIFGRFSAYAFRFVAEACH